MTMERMIELLEIEHRCVLLNSHGDCDRDCANCDLAQDDGELHEMYMDVIALLKRQEPRVMTLDEALGGDECWIEGRNGACGYGDALLTDDGERVDFYRPHRLDTLDFYEYGLSWRCWTSRPTEEQRKAVKWNEDQ